MVQHGDVHLRLGRGGPLEQRWEMRLYGACGVAGKKQPPNGRRRLEWVRQLIDRTDRCSQWPDQERPCPINGRVERVVGRIVMALSAEGQLIAFIEKATGGDAALTRGFLRGIKKHRLNPEVQPMAAGLVM
jgi:hypothetical protein